MDSIPTDPADEMPVEAVLREELAHGDIVLGTIGPILGHLLAQHDHSLFSDEIVARVRGMTRHVAHQILTVQGSEEAPAATLPEVDSPLEARLAALLAGNMNFLVHCHAMALEAQLARRLEERSAIDPVLSPLMQALIASDDPATATTGMAALAAQARFMQQQRRMELPLGELPADLFHSALTIWRTISGTGDGDSADGAEQTLRNAYDEGASRLGLLARLISGLGSGVTAALSISHAGTALFLTALANASRQERDLTVLATNDSQLARMALSLRAAGLRSKDVEEQFLYLHPEVALPDGFDFLRGDRAAGLLASSVRRSAG